MGFLLYSFHALFYHLRFPLAFRENPILTKLEPSPFARFIMILMALQSRTQSNLQHVLILLIFTDDLTLAFKLFLIES